MKYDLLVERLADQHHAQSALRELLAAGKAAVPAVRRGLRHEEAVVRMRERDRHPVVRKVAGRYLPGGPIYRRLAPSRT